MKRLNTTLSKNLLLKKQKLQTDCPKETKEAPNETRVDINLSTPSEVPQETARNSKIVGTPQKEVRNQKPDLQNTNYKLRKDFQRIYSAHKRRNRSN